eukprot:gene4336-14449_t
MSADSYALQCRAVLSVLQVCAETRDSDAALEVMKMLDQRNIKPDTKFLTTLIKVWKSVGKAEMAFKVYLDMKAKKLRLDAPVYGALVSAFAEAMSRELRVVHERKDQYVLLERATQIILEAEASNIRITTHEWNALVLCAGRCGELTRVFDILELMRDRGAPQDAYTYCIMMEACLRADQPQMTHTLLQKALSEGISGSVAVYTVAVTACKAEEAVIAW